MNQGNDFICYRCRQSFECVTTEEEKLNEYIENFGAPYQMEEVVIVCDDCYRKALGLPGLQ